MAVNSDNFDSEAHAEGSQPVPDSPPGGAVRLPWSNFNLERFALILAWLALIAVFGGLRPSTFLTVNNLATAFGSDAMLIILSIGLLPSLTCGDYDLSVGPVMGLGMMMVAVMNGQNGLPIVAVCIFVLLVGGLIGLVNGFFVLTFGIEPFIVTIGTGSVVSGVVLWISNDVTVSGVSPGLVGVVVGSHFLGIPLEFYYALALCVVMWYLLGFTGLGQRMLFAGRGRTVARLSGVRVSRVRLFGLVSASVVAAIAGIVYAGTTASGDPTAGSTFTLPAFAAAFLGATAIRPGRFNAWGTLIAALFLITGITGLTLMGLGVFVQDIFYGGALVIAVALSQVAKRRQAQELTVSS